MESLDVDHSGIELGIRVHKFSQRLGGHIAAACNSYVRMPGTKLRLKADGERGFLYPFVNLK